MALERVMNDAVNLLDLRTPYSDAYMDTVRQARAYLQEHLYEEHGWPRGHHCQLHWPYAYRRGLVVDRGPDPGEGGPQLCHRAQAHGRVSGV